MEISNIPQKVLFAAIVVALFFVGLVDYKQQSAINELEKTILSLPGTSQSQQPDQPPKSLAETIKANAKNDKSFIGEVKEIADDYMMIDATLVDLSKLEEGNDYSKGILPMVQKTFKVFIAPETKFSQKQRSEIKIGDQMVVYADKSPYENDEMKAMAVSPSLQPIESR